MIRGGGALCAPFEGSRSSGKTRMDVCIVQSVQRVVNFTLDDGTARASCPWGRIVPGVTTVCDLPLLFADGLPTCLEDLTLAQLQQFVPHMIQCSGVAAGEGAMPAWWPDELAFSAVPERPPGLPSAQWLAHLKQLVSNCYSHHGCDYALRLCVDSSHKCCSSEWTFVDGLDGTMSLYNKVTRKLSATFRTSNVARFRDGAVPAKSLLAKRGCVPPLTTRFHVPIYLCDACDLKFCTLKEMQSHEKLCSPKYHSLIPYTRKTTRPVISCASNVPSPVSYATRNSEACVRSISTRTCPSLYCPPNVGQEISRETAGSCAANRRTLPAISVQPLKMSCSDSVVKRVPLKWKRGHETPHLVNCTSTAPILRKEPPPVLHPSTFFQPLSSCNQRLTSPSDAWHNNRFPCFEKKESFDLPNKRKEKVVRRMTLMPSKQILQDLSQLRQSDVYLCCYCEMEFATLKDIQIHEKMCCKGREDLTAAPVACERQIGFDQVTFLNYFHLASTSTSQKKIGLKDTPPKKSFRHSLHYSGVPISSVLGIQIHSRHKLHSSVVLGKIEKIERYCLSNQLDHHGSTGAKFDCNTSQVSHKTCKSTNNQWSHTYRHPIQRWWRMPLLRKILMMVESRNQYLLSLCKPLQIKLRRLTTEEIQSFAACRTLTTKVKKLTTEEIQLYAKSRNARPRLRKLPFQKLESYTGPLIASPLLRRLSFQEIQMYTKYSTSSITAGNDHSDVITKSNPLSSCNETIPLNYSKNRRKRKRKI